MNITFWNQQSTGRIGITFENSSGKSEMLVTPRDFNEIKKSFKNAKAIRPRDISESIPKNIAIARIWRGDTYGRFFVLRKALVRMAMPDLAKALDK